eukprot:TRINITY_DN846_c0_g2_i1.p1 TRINITY_DN846_c0_g2~~TRINITY_DN846_c0_g2_i1.p1  ORF type:complete len:240 (+),score=40.25 TRINITY_DN846_c0_g2_i1:94-813(+)
MAKRIDVYPSEVQRVLGSIHLEEYISIMAEEGYATADDLITATEEDLLELGLKKPHMRRLMKEVKNRYPSEDDAAAALVGSDKIDKLLMLKYQQAPVTHRHGDAVSLEVRRQRSENAVKKLITEKKGTRLCRHFATHAGCWLGDSCGFIHDTALVPSKIPPISVSTKAKREKSAEDCAAQGDSATANTHRAKFIAAENSAAKSCANRKTKVCRHYEKGKCWLDDKCAFIHERLPGAESV